VVNLKLIAPDQTFFDGDVYEVMIPTKAGEIAVYEGHAPLIGVAAPGLVSIRKEKSVKDADREFVAVYGGTIEVLNNTVRVLVDEVDTDETISEVEAEKAYQRALDMKSVLSLQGYANTKDATRHYI
jgi:F-type H+-transporting ATPase subunit epsilon